MADAGDYPEYLTLDGGLAMEVYRVLRSQSEELMPTGVTQKLLEARLRDEKIYKATHTAFLENGADVILTNTYKPSIEMLMGYLHISEEECLDHFRNAVIVARQIRDEFWEDYQRRNPGTGTRHKPLVAGSQCSFGGRAFANDEYIGVHVKKAPISELIESHRPKVQALVAGGVDLIAFETVPLADEGEAVCQLMREFPGVKAWLSFSCKDGEHTCHGEPFREAVMTSLKSDQIVAVGLNCTNPKYVTSLLDEIPAEVKRQKRIVVYPNNGLKWECQDKFWFGERSPPIHTYVSEWVEHGANWVGGCCNVTAKDISDIRTEMERLGKCPPREAA